MTTARSTTRSSPVNGVIAKSEGYEVDVPVALTPEQAENAAVTLEATAACSPGTVRPRPVQHTPPVVRTQGMSNHSEVPAPLQGHDADRRGAPVGRRMLLGMVGLGALGVVAGSPAQRLLADSIDTVAQKDPTGLSGLLPGNHFRYYSITSSVPEKNATNYSLTVDGMVAEPATYTLSDLAALPQQRTVLDVQCVTGWRVPHYPFGGVRLSTILDAAGVSPEARAVRFTCFDGEYTESLTMEQARRADVIVATSMDDKPITHSHGGPVRLYVAPMYFYKSAKWLSGISVTKDVVPGYWEGLGYDVDAWVGRSNGRDDAPTV